MIISNYVLKIQSGYLAFEFLTYSFYYYYFLVSFVVVVVVINPERPIWVQNIGYMYVKYFKFFFNQGDLLDKENESRITVK